MDPPLPATATRERLPAVRGLVQREELFERLSSARPGGVILVCAPAGSGKSVLVHSWVEAGGPGDRVAWVSVERGERDAQRFWLSVIDACASVGGGDEFVERVSPSPSFRGEAVVERLLSDLALLEEPIVLVIDDLHELGSADALHLLERFLTRLPPQVRVALASREDPGLGLHRLRLAGGLTELRAPDLRFSRDEARQLLEAAGITLPDAAVALLHERTEGWAAGLRLAAISLAEHADPERFVSEFSGSERSVAGYLLAEVLERQPKEVRELPAAHIRAQACERAAGRRAQRRLGVRADPATARGRQRVRHVARRRTVRGFATTTCSPISCALSCDAAIPRASTRYTERPPNGTRSTGTRWMRFAMLMRRRTGRAPPACSPKARSVSALTAARRRSTRFWPPSRRRPPRRTQNWRSCSRRTACSTARSRRPPHTSRPRTRRPGPCPPSGVGTSTWSGPASGSRWPAGKVISRRLRRRCGPSKRPPRLGPQATWRSATTTERRR